MAEVGNDETVQQSPSNHQEKKGGFKLAFWRKQKEQPVASNSQPQPSESLSGVRSELATMGGEAASTPEVATNTEVVARPEVSVSNDKQQEPLDVADVMEDEVQTSAAPDTIVESEARLRPSRKIFFHTTPSQNVASLREHGLMAHKNTDTVGRDLLYSLAFADEYNEISGSPVQDFTLTIWQNNNEIKKRTMPSGNISDSQYTAVGSIESGGVPGAYQQNLADRRFGHRGASEDIKGISSEHLLATIPITEASQRLLVQCKLDFFNNVATSDEIEQRLLKFIQTPDSSIQLGAQTTPEDLAYDLTARMQQEVLRYEASSIAQIALQQIGELQNGTRVIPRELTNELSELRTKSERVNDPLSQRYLSMWVNQCRRALGEKGMAELYTTARSNIKDVYTWAGDIGVDYNKLWGGNDGWKLVRKIRAV